MRPTNPNTLRWLDTSIYRYLKAKAAADGFTVCLGTSFSAKLDGAQVASAVIYTDTWKQITEPADTLVTGSLDIMLRVDCSQGEHDLKQALGKFAAYLDCIQVFKFGASVDDDNNALIGQLTVDSEMGIVAETLGYVDSNQVVISGCVKCFLTGRLTGV